VSILSDSVRVFSTGAKPQMEVVKTRALFRSTQLVHLLSFHPSLPSVRYNKTCPINENARPVPKSQWGARKPSCIHHQIIQNIDTAWLPYYHTGLKYHSPILLFPGIDVFPMLVPVHIVIREGLSLI
jgi:hypothetical protein